MLMIGTGMKSAAASAVVKKVYKDDFEKVYGLLSDFRDPSLEKNQWRQLFINTWGNFEGYCGYGLVARDEIVGFLGTVFSKRYLNGKEYKFCNLSSWIVKPKYRAKSISLLWPVLKLKDYTITNLTCAPTLYNLFKKLGFKDLGSFRVIFPPIPPYKLNYGKSKYCIIEDQSIINKRLSHNDLLIFNDHINYKCIHIIIAGDNGECYIVATRVRKKGLPFIYIHYISNLFIFTELIYKTALQILVKHKSMGIMVDERLLRSQKFSLAIKNKAPVFKVYKSLSLPPDDIDNLYTELILLNL